VDLGMVWSPTQFADVEGHLSHLNAIAADELLFEGATNPEGTCVAADQVYDSDANPGGVRCGILDYLMNILGPRPPEVWSPNEQLLGHGFGGSFIDNVGIQYGLDALRRSAVSTSTSSRARHGSTATRPRSRTPIAAARSTTGAT
jgi:hypothetical protein